MKKNRGGGSRAGRARAGFTILEVVLAMGILVVGMTSLLSLFTFGAALARSAEMRARSSAIIEAVVADLEESLFPLEEDGRAGEPSAIEERPLEGVEGAFFSATPIPNPDDPSEYKVEVEVHWSSKGVQRSRSFTVLLLREVPFDVRLRRRFSGR